MSVSRVRQSLCHYPDLHRLSLDQIPLDRTQALSRAATVKSLKYSRQHRAQSSYQDDLWSDEDKLWSYKVYQSIYPEEWNLQKSKLKTSHHSRTSCCLLPTASWCAAERTRAPISSSTTTTTLKSSNFYFFAYSTVLWVIMADDRPVGRNCSVYRIGSVMFIKLQEKAIFYFLLSNHSNLSPAVQWPQKWNRGEGFTVLKTNNFTTEERVPLIINVTHSVKIT